MSAGNSSLIERQITNLIRSATDQELIDKSSIGILGTPDLSSRRAKVAVFVDGCYWHGCPNHTKDERAAERRARDERVNVGLADRGWVVLRVWEHEEHLAPFIAEVATTISERANLTRLSERAHVAAHLPGEWCDTCSDWPHPPLARGDGWCARCLVHENDHTPEHPTSSEEEGA
ncbi:hypothetical protein ACFRLW_10395 [Streptomyces sp. NPDC056728]